MLHARLMASLTTSSSFTFLPTLLFLDRRLNLWNWEVKWAEKPDKCTWILNLAWPLQLRSVGLGVEPLRAQFGTAEVGSLPGLWLVPRRGNWPTQGFLLLCLRAVSVCVYFKLDTVPTFLSRRPLYFLLVNQLFRSVVLFLDTGGRRRGSCLCVLTSLALSRPTEVNAFRGRSPSFTPVDRSYRGTFPRQVIGRCFFQMVYSFRVRESCHINKTSETLAILTLRVALFGVVKQVFPSSVGYSVTVCVRGKTVVTVCKDRRDEMSAEWGEHAAKTAGALLSRNQAWGPAPAAQK